jgi:hypothetical protein
MMRTLHKQSDQLRLKSWSAAVGVFLLLLIADVPAPRIRAQSIGGTEQWSIPQRVPGLSDNIWTPFLVADQNRTIHAFVSDWVGQSDLQLAIVYSRWTVDQGWTSPVDILLPSRGQARLQGVLLDAAGVMHLAFFGGDDIAAGIYYARASAARAGEAPAWSEPQAVGGMAITPDAAALAGDGAGNLFIVYAGGIDGHGLYSVYSTNGGDSWSEPVAVFLTYSNELWPLALQTYVDRHNNLHAVWTLVDTSGNGLAVYFSTLDADTGQWTEPAVLAEAVNFEADTATLIEYQNELFVIYHNDRPTTRWMRRSVDGGETWTEPIRLFQQIGTNGAASLVIDGRNVMHMFFGNRVGPHPAIHGMWHSLWDGDRWSTPEAIVAGLSGPSFDPARARAVVSQGNTILVLWVQEPGRPERNGAWYAYLTIDAPALPVVALPSPGRALAKDVPAAEAPGPVATASPSLILVDDLDEAPDVSSDPLEPVISAILPVFVLVVMLTLWQAVHHYFRR